MRTEKEIRERHAEIESIIHICNKWGVSDSTLNAFHAVLEWVLQTSEDTAEAKE